jgi:hypothetical protein
VYTLTLVIYLCKYFQSKNIRGAVLPFIGVVFDSVPDEVPPSDPNPAEWGSSPVAVDPNTLAIPGVYVRPERLFSSA